MVTALVFTLPTGTAGPKDKLYPWERKHKSPATTTDAVLCYGASHHRNPFLWDKGRFAPYVTYVDPEGKEQWLFDGFIFLESQDVDRPDSGAYSFMTGVLRDTGVSAGKEQWQELIDYYFTKGNCVDALEQAVKEATARLGKAPCKRRVIMMIPDPIIVAALPLFIQAIAILSLVLLTLPIRQFPTAKYTFLFPLSFIFCGSFGKSIYNCPSFALIFPKEKGISRFRSVACAAVTTKSGL